MNKVASRWGLWPNLGSHLPEGASSWRAAGSRAGGLKLLPAAPSKVRFTRVSAANALRPYRETEAIEVRGSGYRVVRETQEKARAEKPTPSNFELETGLCKPKPVTSSHEWQEIRGDWLHLGYIPRHEGEGLGHSSRSEAQRDGRATGLPTRRSARSGASVGLERLAPKMTPGMFLSGFCPYKVRSDHDFAMPRSATKTPLTGATT